MRQLRVNEVVGGVVSVVTLLVIVWVALTQSKTVLQTGW
jgi:hypothetical protein